MYENKYKKYNIDSSWKKLFNGDFGFLPFKANEDARNLGQHEFPKDEDTFRFATTPINNIKCVIVGMEPYASWYIDKKTNDIIPQATGRSFEVDELKDKTWLHKFKQASLRNIGKCLYLCEKGESVTSQKFREEIENNNFFIANPNDWFENLSNQGVCFLNAALTVKKDTPGTGKEYWEDFGKAFVEATKENKNIVWFLLGKDAQNTFLPYLKAVSYNESNIICTPHPRMASFSKEPWFLKCSNINWSGI